MNMSCLRTYQIVWVMLAMIGDCEGAGQVDRMSNNGGLKGTETSLAYVEHHKEWG